MLTSVTGMYQSVVSAYYMSNCTKLPSSLLHCSSSSLSVSINNDGMTATGEFLYNVTNICYICMKFVFTMYYSLLLDCSLCT